MDQFSDTKEKISMLSQKRILSITAALAIGALSAFAQTPSKSTSSAAKQATASKPSAPKAHVAEGSVVSSTDDMTFPDLSFKSYSRWTVHLLLSSVATLILAESGPGSTSP